VESPHFENIMLKESIHCHQQHYPGENWQVKPHYHKETEIVYMVSGQTQVFIHGKNHLLKKGDLIFIESESIHSFYGESDWDSNMIIVKFNMELLHASSKTYELHYINFLLNSSLPSPFKYVFDEDETKSNGILTLLTGMLEEYDTKKFGYELSLRIGISQLILWMIRIWQPEYSEINDIFNKADVESFKEVCEYIANNYNEQLTAEDAAKKSNMSYSYFSRRFKVVIGKSFKEYVNYVRMIEAEKLLLNSNMSITEIALETGFSNTSYFIKQFQKIRGFPPKKYKSHLKVELSNKEKYF
jgi:AraC-like DNA-binding protein